MRSVWERLIILYFFSSVSLVVVVMIPFTALTDVIFCVPGPTCGIDFGAEVDGVGDQPFFIGLDIEDAGVASVDAAFEDGDGSLVQVCAGGVLELEAEQGCLAWTAWL